MISELRFHSDFLYKAALIISLVILILNAWNAPISGDEYVHVEQAEKNIRYLQSLGQDNEALHTPISRLKHYGQTFDTLTTWAAQIFSIDNLYRFRHISNSFIAWLTILFTSLITIQLTRSKGAGIVTIILMILTARFMGHAMNNLKDIPFAFSFIFSIYCIFQFLDRLPVFSWKYIFGIILGLAFSISIRIGGLLIYAYFLLFLALWIYYLIQKGELKINTAWSLKVLGITGLTFIIGYFLGIIFWPWALEAPITNPLLSLDMMKNYPTTVRQTFEGELYWSDRFPWYYLFKYLLITLPIIVLLGLAGFFAFMPKNSRTLVKSVFLLIAFGFPLFYAATTGANVYGGWRQMLFVFPPLVILSAIGIWHIYLRAKNHRIWNGVVMVVFLLSTLHPLYYSIANYPYQYTFFNAMQGGFQGAYGKYELDYYFTSFKEAYDYIDQELDVKEGTVAANFIIPEYYKGKPYRSKLIDYYNRSAEDWDYAIICNTFLNPVQLKNNVWPPENTIYQIKNEGKPILAIINRQTKLDIEGIQLLKNGKVSEAIQKLDAALDVDQNNESILINFARAQMIMGNFDVAQSALGRLFKIYPDNEWGKDLEGELKLKLGEYDAAKTVFNNIIKNNYKFFHAYINLAKTEKASGDEDKAIEVLKSCLRINPFYQPAYQAYGKILIGRGELELGNQMLEFRIEGNSKYGRE